MAAIEVAQLPSFVLVAREEQRGINAVGGVFVQKPIY